MTSKPADIITGAIPWGTAPLAATRAGRLGPQRCYRRERQEEEKAFFVLKDFYERIARSITKSPGQ